MKNNGKLKYIYKVLFAALFLVNVSGIQGVYGGSSSDNQITAKILISASVLERTTVKVFNQVQDIVVSQADIVRGYVEINAATRLQVSSNNPAGYLLVFEVMSGPYSIFNLVILRLGNREVQLPPDGGWVPQPYVRGGALLDLSYRFLLSKHAQPGTYSWPLVISVHRI